MEQTVGVREANNTGNPEDADAARTNVSPTRRLDNEPNVMICGARATVKDTELLVTEPEDAVTDALPTATAVTVLPESVTAVPVNLNVGVIANGFPYWSRPSAVNVAVPPTVRADFDASKEMDCSTAGAFDELDGAEAQPEMHRTRITRTADKSLRPGFIESSMPIVYMGWGNSSRGPGLILGRN